MLFLSHPSLWTLQWKKMQFYYSAQFILCSFYCFDLSQRVDCVFWNLEHIISTKSIFSQKDLLLIFIVSASKPEASIHQRF